MKKLSCVFCGLLVVVLGSCVSLDNIDMRPNPKKIKVVTDLIDTTIPIEQHARLYIGEGVNGITKSLTKYSKNLAIQSDVLLVPPGLLEYGLRGKDSLAFEKKVRDYALSKVLGKYGSTEITRTIFDFKAGHFYYLNAVYDPFSGVPFTYQICDGEDLLADEREILSIGMQKGQNRWELIISAIDEAIALKVR